MDNVRPNDLKLPVIADLIVNSADNLSAATNDPTRGYALHPDFKNLIVNYGTATWNKKLKAFNKKSLHLLPYLQEKETSNKSR